MSTLNKMIAELCPNGVEKIPMGSLMTRVTERGKDDLNVSQVYVVSNTAGIVCAEDFRENTIHSEDTSNYTVVRKGMVAYNPSRLNIGSIAMLNADTPGLVSPMYVVFSIDERKVIQRYFEYLMHSSYVANKINSLKEEGARFRFDFSRWNWITIQIPPKSIQEKIVGVLDDFVSLQDNLKAELQLRKKQYEHYKDELLHSDSDRREWMTIEDCTEKTVNIKWKLTNQSFQYVDLSSVDRETSTIRDTTVIDASNAPSRAQQIIQEDDILFGTTRPLLRRCCLVPSEYDGQIASTGYCVLRANKNIVRPKWLYYWITTDDFYSYIKPLQVEGNYPSVSNGNVKGFSIPIPSLSEQDKIIAILEQFDALCNDIFKGLPAEIEARQKQYEYYRDKLLTFKEKES